MPGPPRRPLTSGPPQENALKKVLGALAKKAEKQDKELEWSACPAPEPAAPSC